MKTKFTILISVLLVTGIFVTAFASAGIFDWLKGDSSDKDYSGSAEPGVIDNVMAAEVDDGEPSADVFDGSGGGGGPIPSGNNTVYKILALNEKIDFSGGGWIKLNGVNPATDSCMISFQYSQYGSNGAGWFSMGELEVLEGSRGDVVIGVTNLREDPDYCAIVLRYPYP